jgi:hypothetical protein
MTKTVTKWERLTSMGYPGLRDDQCHPGEEPSRQPPGEADSAHTDRNHKVVEAEIGQRARRPSKLGTDPARPVT